MPGDVIDQPPKHVAELRRVAVVLMVISAVWFGVVVVKTDLSSGFKIDLLPLLVFGAGFTLLSGHLRMASLLRWIAAFGVVGIPIALLVGQIETPWVLTRALLTHRMDEVIWPWAVGLISVFVMVWLIRTLGSPSILEARHIAGRPSRRLWIPMVSALIIGLAALVSLHWMLGGDAAKKAEALVLEQVGPGHEAKAIHLGLRMGPSGSRREAVVVVWRGDEVRVVPVYWDEP